MHRADDRETIASARERACRRRREDSSRASGYVSRAPRSDPNAVLGLGARRSSSRRGGLPAPWLGSSLLLEGSSPAAALLYAWRTQDRLRLAPVLALALGFHSACIARAPRARRDAVTRTRASSSAGRATGSSTGDYPRSEYPLGAVLLFAFEAWVGGGATRTANAIVMIPFQLAIVARSGRRGRPLRAVARGVRRALAAERVLLGVQVRPRALRHCWRSGWCSRGESAGRCPAPCSGSARSSSGRPG